MCYHHCRLEQSSLEMRRLFHHHQSQLVKFHHNFQKLSQQLHLLGSLILQFSFHHSYLHPQSLCPLQIRQVLYHYPQLKHQLIHCQFKCSPRIITSIFSRTQFLSPKMRQSVMSKRGSARLWTYPKTASAYGATKGKYHPNP